jgi:2-haloacid dehalogenase
METLDVLTREIKALAFDQYGTIVDMQKGLTEAVTRAQAALPAHQHPAL